MKKTLFILTMGLGLIAVINSCSKDKSEDPGHLVINGQSVVLAYGQIDTIITSSESNSIYWIRLKSSDISRPEHFMVLKLYSTSPEMIVEGTYTYDFQPEGGGDFTWVKIGSSLVYDDAGTLTGGLTFCDYMVIEGTLDVTKEGDKYRFEFNLSIEDDLDNTYTVTGDFVGLLNDADISYGDIFQNCE